MNIMENISFAHNCCFQSNQWMHFIKRWNIVSTENPKDKEKIWFKKEEKMLFSHQLDEKN